MKSILYFIFGVIFTLFIFSIENQNERESIHTNTFQTTIVKNNTDCIIASFNFKIKPIFKEIILFRLDSENERYSENLKIDKKSELFIKTSRQRNIRSQRLIITVLRLIRYSSADDCDDHNHV